MSRELDLRPGPSGGIDRGERAMCRTTHPSVYGVPGQVPQG